MGASLGKRLVITEKPSVARDICDVLGGFEDEGEYYENDDYVITFAVGHLLELAEPQDYDKALRAWTIATLPIIPEVFKIKPKDGQKKRLDLIKKLGRRKDVDGVINACDAGREGEIIFRRILEYTGLGDRPHQRLWLQSMTAGSIKKAFLALMPGEQLDALGDAAWLRGVGDWLIGINATRALTKRLKGKRERGAWSAGRVQTPTLGLLVTREHEILAHIPVTYWAITATFTHGEQSWEGRYYDETQSGNEDRNIRPGRIFQRPRADEVMAAAAANATAPASEKRRKSKQKPPLPFDLTSLQREANRRFSLSAKRTLNAAQRLYEQHKVLTYPRTDSRHLPSDYEEVVRETLSSLETDVAYRSLAEGVSADPQNLDRILNDSKISDHFAIVPTGAEPPTGLGADDSRIYDLVVRQFLASLMGPATWAVVERQVVIPVDNGTDAAFRTSARSLEIPGFLEALGQEAGAGSSLPALVLGKDSVDGVEVAVSDAVEEEKLTRPASRYSESQLLRLMETAGERIEDEDLVEAMKGRGLGTPATRADIIERLVRTEYARRVDGKLGPSAKGMRLMDILQRADVPVLGSPALTGQWEHALQQVQDGVVPREKALADLQDFTRNVTESLAGFDHDALYASDPDLGECPSCKIGRVTESAWGYRCSRNTQKDAECKFILWKDRGGRYIDRTLAMRLVKERRSGKIEGFADRYGRSLTGEIILEPDSDEPGDSWTMRIEYGEPSGDALEPETIGDVLFPCPCENEDCKGIVETSRRYVCEAFLERRAKKGPILPKVVCQRNMEPEEVAAFFAEEARTPTYEGFISRRGRPFRGLLFRKPTGKHGFEFPPREPRAKKGGKTKAGKKSTAKKKSPAKKKSTAKRKSAAKKKAPAKKRAPAKKKAAAKKKAPAKRKSTAKTKSSSKSSSKSSAEAATKKDSTKSATKRKTSSPAGDAAAPETPGSS